MTQEGEAKRKVLFIEGFCNVPWMDKRFQRACGNKSAELDVENSAETTTAENTRVDWDAVDPMFGDKIDGTHIACFARDEKTFKLFFDETNAITQIQQELNTGSYHAIVIVDFAKEFDLFQTKIGKPFLEPFCRAGGAVIFASTELTGVATMTKVFKDIKWTPGDYGTYTFGPCTENDTLLQKCFTTSSTEEEEEETKKEFQVQSVTLVNVPPHERCFGLTLQERAATISPEEFGQEQKVAMDDPSRDYPVLVAHHAYNGKNGGSVLFIGDVNLQTPSLILLGKFISSRPLEEPIDVFCRITANAMDQVLKYKQLGNTAFGSSDYQKALEHYAMALTHYNGKRGKLGKQHMEHVNLHANRAECALRLQQFALAEECATHALKVAQKPHAKALIRRAKARYQLSKFQLALDDLHALPKESPDEIKLAQSLMGPIKTQLDKVQTKQKNSFLAGFGNAIQQEAN